MRLYVQSDRDLSVYECLQVRKLALDYSLRVVTVSVRDSAFIFKGGPVRLFKFARALAKSPMDRIWNS